MPLSIMLQSNAMWVASGYGGTTKTLMHIWRSLKHRVGLFASFGLEGGRITYDGFDVFGRGYNQYGVDVAAAHCKKWGADVLITNIDTFVLNGGNYGGSGIPWLPICPPMEDPLTPGISGSLRGSYALISISNYGKEILEKAGWHSTMIPLPVDTGQFFPLDKKAAKRALGFDENCYLIGNVGMNRGSRKGHDLLLPAFAEILKEIPEAVLYIHTDTRQPDGLPLEDLARTLGLKPGQFRFPVQYDAYFGQTSDWMNVLYNAFDLYIQPSRAEGQGMPVYEALSVGNPVIGTDCTALTEVLHKADAMGLPVVNKLWMPSTGFSYETAHKPIYDGILAAYERWGKNYVSAHNRQLAIDSVSVPVVGLCWQEYLSHLEQQLRYAPPVNVVKNVRTTAHSGKIRLAQVSTTVQNCGIGAYTRALNAALGDDFEIRPTVEIRTFTDAAQIPDDVDIVHVQHEPAILPPHDALEHALRDVRDRGVKVITTYHSVVPEGIERYFLEGVTDYGIIHWPPTALKNLRPELKILGGMGCPSFAAPRTDLRATARAQFGFKESDLVISTFGFASVGRGHFELPYEMLGYLKAQPEIKFQIITAGNFLNDVGAQIVAEELGALAKRHGVQDQIIFLTDYRPDNEVLLRLWCSDVGYLYMGADTTSSSSAIRYFISAQLPTVISPSTHFADVRRGVIICDSFTTQEMAQKVYALLYDQTAQQLLRKEHLHTYNLWRWPQFATRMAAIYQHVMES